MSEATNGAKRLQRVTIRNILGIEELAIESPGPVTVISGGNGTGKTSILEAVRAAIGGGHDATLLRKGAEEGEAVLVLEDGTEIHRRVTAGGSTKNVTHPEMGRIGSPQTFVNGLVDAVSLDPASFLAGDGAARVRMLMEAWPVEVTPDQLQEAVGDTYQLPQIQATNALEAVAAASKAVYDERTGENRTAKEKAATANQLAEGLPEDAADADEIRSQVEALEDERDGLIETRDEEVSAARDGFHARKDEIQEAAAEKIREIERKRDAAIEEARQQAVKDAGAASEKYDGQIEELRQEVSTLTERSRHAAAHAQTRKTVAQMEQEAAAAKQKSKALTAALGRLDALKGELAAEIPIKGVSIVDGEVHIDGIPFPRLNHAKQLETAISLAAKRSGKLGIVCVDGLEALDGETWPKLIAGLEEAGLQAFVTRVTSGPLSVEGASA